MNGETPPTLPLTKNILGEVWRGQRPLHLIGLASTLRKKSLCFPPASSFDWTSGAVLDTAMPIQYSD